MAYNPGSEVSNLIVQVNKTKRLDWATQHQADTFEDVIFTDETTVQLETHRRFCCRKKGEQPRSKPRYDLELCTLLHKRQTFLYLNTYIHTYIRTYIHKHTHANNIIPVVMSYLLSFFRPKHPAKVHVWAGISWHGPTSVCVFEGKMNAPLFVEILEKTLVPFVAMKMPDHKFMQVCSSLLSMQIYVPTRIVGPIIPENTARLFTM